MTQIKALQVNFHPGKLDLGLLVWTDKLKGIFNLSSAYLINWDLNPFLEPPAWFIKKCKQFNQSEITSDIGALTMTLSVNSPLWNWGI